MIDLIDRKPSHRPLSYGVVAIAVALLAGCGSAPERRPATSHQPVQQLASPAAVQAVTPPGSTEFSFDDGRVRSFATEAPRTRLQPGHTFRPRHLSIH